RAVVLFIAAAIGFTACGDGEGDSTSSSTTNRTHTQTNTQNRVGQETKNGAIGLKITKVTSSPTLIYQGGNQTEVTPNGIKRIVHAPQGGRYVLVQAVVTNDSHAGIDISCGLPVQAKAFDDKGRQFDSDQNLFLIAGNPECNVNVQPGFKHKVTWPFLVPPGTKVTTFSYSDQTALSNANAATVTIEERPPTQITIPPI
ncbi:MAG: hypothetical protein QOG26_1042, partial [Solirubrobacterales bacterium]|nr:hypothetical protein [Solirubrobacterales bacterium]